MKLYKETGTNPLSSCLPILVQSPFFFALYHVLSYIAQGKTVGVITDPVTVASAHSATIFGAPIYESFRSSTDVNTKIVAAVMILLMTATTFITQRQLMVKNQPLGQQSPMMQQQKILLYVFPLMFAVFGINFPIGVLIYWLTTNLWTMGQQFYRHPAQPDAGQRGGPRPAEAPAGREGRRQGRRARPRRPAPPWCRPRRRPRASGVQPKRAPRAQRSRSPTAAEVRRSHGHDGRRARPGQRGRRTAGLTVPGPDPDPEPPKPRTMTHQIRRRT